MLINSGFALVEVKLIYLSELSYTYIVFSSTP